MICERCKAKPLGFALFDYCRHCSKTLCSHCMLDGCCGHVPAESGAEDTYPEDMSEEDDV